MGGGPGGRGKETLLINVNQTLPRRCIGGQTQGRRALHRPGRAAGSTCSTRGIGGWDYLQNRELWRLVLAGFLLLPVLRLGAKGEKLFVNN